MNSVINNILGMNAQRMYNINTRSKAKISEKLASGYRINRSADDAAGVSISEKMRRQIQGLTKGVENTQQGVSLCQVADGALAEVNEMLHRITELSVQAANGTNTEQERNAIQEEIRHILNEIDRIGDTTFNEQPIFQGTDEVIKNADGTDASWSSVQVKDITLANVDLGKQPLVNGEGGDMMHLQAIVKNSDLALNGQSFNLIYGSGSTSNSSLRITDASGRQTVVSMDSLTQSNYTTNGTNQWSRDFTYSAGAGVNLTVTQKVKLDESDVNNNEKKYNITYEFSNASNINNVEFMFHVDTAYNNNDLCEGYYIDGNRVENYCIYNQSSAGSNLTNPNSATAPVSPYVKDNMPGSLSIIDVDNALSFSEKITFGTRQPDSLSIGHYSEIDDWSYYNSLDTKLGENTTDKDLGFSLYYNLGGFPGDKSVSFDYGIVSTTADNNVKNLQLELNKQQVFNHTGQRSFWIQSGTEALSGMYVDIDEMNTSYLGISNLDVSTVAGANRAMESVGNALQKVINNRAGIGVQQNRLEHIITNEQNIIENTTAAESRIRDTDMAKEMVDFSKLSILEQVGQSMMAQANQSNQGVLHLLQ